MVSVTRFGMLDHNVLMLLECWELVERAIHELCERAYKMTFDEHREVLRYIADMSSRHAEFIARIGGEYGAVRADIEPGELKEVADATRVSFKEVGEVIERARGEVDPLKILTLIEEVEDLATPIISSIKTVAREGSALSSAAEEILGIIEEEAGIRRRAIKRLINILKKGELERKMP